MQDSDDRTELPTNKRIADARLKGQHFKSPELSSAVTLLLSVGALAFFLPSVWQSLGEWCRWSIAQLDGREIDLPLASYGGAQGIYAYLLLLLPLLGTLAGGGLLAQALQVGAQVSAYPLRPRWSQLNIFNRDNYRKWRGTSPWVKAGLHLVRLGGAGVLTGAASFVLLSEGIPFTSWSAPDGGQTFARALLVYAGLLALFFLALGLFDYFYQKALYRRRLKMSKREVREERKEAQMDPLWKSQMRSRQSPGGRRRLAECLARAAVVVVDPPQRALALAYAPASGQAPVCVAKAAFEGAQRLVNQAQQQRVPVVTHPSFVQALFPLVRVEDALPPLYYAQAAEILVKAAKEPLQPRKG